MTRLRHPAWFALGLVLVDGLLFQQYVWSVGGALLGAVVAGVRSWRRDALLVAVARVAIPVLGAVVAGAIITGNRELAWSRAYRIIDEAERYHAEHGVYPDTLQQLPSVPLARYALMFPTFGYAVVDGRHELWWVDVPPFGIPMYEFEARRWCYSD